MKPFDPTPSVLTEEDKAIIDRIIAEHDNDPTQLVGILLDVQAASERKHISKPVAVYIADKVGVKITRIYDVVSFYSALHVRPRAKYPLEVCNSASCRVKSGKIPGSRRASMDFPEPGGPDIRILCPPAAAISKARFTFSCPLT